MSQLTLGKESDFVGEIKITMWIPQELGGKVVGKQGILISNIKIETGCTLVNAMKPLDSSLWSAIVIIGKTIYNNHYDIYQLTNILIIIIRHPFQCIKSIQGNI